MKSIVISGSGSLQSKINKWIVFWQSRGYRVIASVQPIEKKKFLKRWPAIHKNFYENLAKTDIHFIANENAKNQKGYIGNGVFAEIAFSVGLNFVRKKKVEIILLQKPDSKNKFAADINLWLKSGWLKISKNS